MNIFHSRSLRLIFHVRVIIGLASIRNHTVSCTRVSHYYTRTIFCLDASERAFQRSHCTCISMLNIYTYTLFLDPFFPSALPYRGKTVDTSNWIQEMTRMKSINRRFTVFHDSRSLYDISHRSVRKIQYAFANGRDMLRNIHGTLVAIQYREVN